MYSFYFGRMQLPVAPEKLSVKIKGSNKTLTLVNEGEINFLRYPGLTEISFDIVLPMLGKYPFASEYKRPDYYLNTFEYLMTERKPFNFIVSRTAPSGRLLYDYDIKVSLENYTVTEDAKNGFDVTVSITLKQYIEYATKIVKVVKTEDDKPPVLSEEKTRDSGSAPKVSTYTVASGDSLWKIAKKYYGNGAEYTKIYNANKDKIKNPNLIYVGQVLTIP